MRSESILEVHFSRLDNNLSKIKKLAPKAKILPMIKANAYGHGILPLAQFMFHEYKLTEFGVASRGEALKVFNQDPLFKGQIFVFSDTDILHPELSLDYLHYPMVPVLHQLSHVQRVISDKNFEFLPLVIKLNTGMNRLGIEKSEWPALVTLLKKYHRKEIFHLMTHFAVSFHVLKENDKTHRQFQEFKIAQKYFEDEGVSILNTSVSNSGAIEQKFGIDETYIRPGLMLYGPGSVDVKKNHPWTGECISNLKTTILKKFQAKRGTPIGYGVNVMPEDATILVLPIGYGDGIFTFWSGVEFILKNHRAKVFGRVNMDMMFIQLPIEAFSDFKEGEVIELWGNEWSQLVELSSQMKTIPYQLFCALSDRLSRVYRIKSSNG